MTMDWFDGGSFVPRASSIPMFLTAAAVLIVGAVTIVRERGSHVVGPLAGLTVGLTIWMLGTAGAFVADEFLNLLKNRSKAEKPVARSINPFARGKHSAK